MALTKATYPIIQSVQTATNPSVEYIEFMQRTANYTGGTPGNVSSALKAKSTVQAGVANFEWTITSVLDNYATAGENVAVYGQGNKRSQTGPTWAGVFEAKDWSASSANPSGGLVGIEVDVFANGTDVSNNRIGIDIVAGRTNPADTTCRVTWGMRMLAQANNPANATYQGGILLNATMTTGIQLAGSMTRGIYLTGSSTVGIDFEAGTFSSGAIRFGTSQVIGLEPTNQVVMEMPSASDLMLKLKNSGTEYVGFKIGAVNPGLYVNTIKVVGARQAAIPNSGDATVNAILAALRTHGLIAT